MKRLTLLFLSLFLVISLGYSQGVGSMAPGFTLNKLGGGSGSLSDYNGKVVLVFLFGNSCPSCIGAASTIQSELIDEFSSNPDFAVIGLDVWDGSASQVQNFKNSTGFSFDLYLQGGSVASSWSMTYDRLAVIDASGNFAYKGTGLASTTVNATKSALTAALNDVSTSLNERQKSFLKQNFPNPFSVSTTIPFVLQESSRVMIDVLDLSGKLIENVADGYYTSGEHSVEFERKDLNQGLYFYRIKADNKVETHIMNIR